MGLSLEEQETIICIMRDENIAHISTSDSTMMTKLNKRVETNPEEWKVVDENENYKFYECPKNLISYRTKTGTGIERTEEQKLAATERLRKYHERKRLEKEQI